MVLISAAAALAGFVSGLMARIVKSWPNRSWRAGQGTGQGLYGRDGPAPGVILKASASPPMTGGADRDHFRAGNETVPDGTVAWTGST